MMILMGLPGVGKSSVLSGLGKRVPHMRIVNYGDVMLEVFKSKFGVADRDQMRKSPLEQQEVAQREAAQRIAAMGRDVILDTHCSIKTDSGYLPGLPHRLLSQFKVDYLVLLSAPPEDIAKRRAKDPSRKRAVDIGEIIEHDSMNRSFLAAYSVLSGAPASVVMNADNKVEEAVGHICGILGIPENK
jgi:adenylate kinase